MKTLLLAIILTGITLSTSIPPQPQSCIDSCKCSVTNNKLKVSKCSKPFELSKLSNIKTANDINTIEIVEAHITGIKGDAFLKLDSLKSVSFKKCTIDSIDITAFDYKIEQLLFIMCDFTKPISNFDSDSLKELMFANCNLNEIPKFGMLKKLESLNLVFNNFDKVEVDAFKDLKSLKTLVLSNNNITVLPDGVFRDNGELSTLYLDSNPLRVFSGKGLKLLELLSLQSCELTVFDATSTLGMDMLTQLDVSDNKLLHFPNEALENMTDLTYIDLSKNHLKHLDASVFINNRKLEKIVLDGNNFFTLPSFATSDNTYATNYFSCKHCGIQSLSKDTFKHMPSITSLDLSNNGLNIIDLVFQDIRSLSQLDLSHNGIINIHPNAFSLNHNLESVTLTNNSLRSLDPKIFAEAKALRSLDIQLTELRKLWANNKTILNSIEELKLSDNKIETLSVDDLNVTPHLKYIQMDNNPLKCNEETKLTFSYLINKRIQRLIRTHDDLQEDDTEYLQEDDNVWKDILNKLCPNLEITTTVTPDFDNQHIPDYYDEDEDDYGDEIDNNSNVNILVNNKTFLNDRTNSDTYQDIYQYEQEAEDLHNFTLTKASYILSLTAVFILTALVVVITSVSATLFFLRRSSNVNTSNLPHIKIPLWSATKSQKKHSGSVYQHLSEEYSCPPTPQVHRYDFTTKPTNHTTIN